MALFEELPRSATVRAVAAGRLLGIQRQKLDRLWRVDPDLVEWNYGAYEGRTTADIRRERPDWQLFRDGGPGDKPSIGRNLGRVQQRTGRRG